MKYVGLKGYSRYHDMYSLSFEEIRELSKREKIFVALNRVKEADELIDAAKKLGDVEGFILNEIAAIKELSKERRIVASVGLTPLNDLDLEFFEDLGAFAVVIPPELNDEIDSFRTRDIKIEAFGRALVEMFYKGKCLLSAYADGTSVKRDGICTKVCCRNWKVYIGCKEICNVDFSPKLMEFDVKADLIKIEGRQFGKRIMEVKYGVND